MRETRNQEDLHWLSLVFGDREVEREFRADYRKKSLVHVRALFLVLAALGLIGGVAGALLDRLFTNAAEHSSEFQQRVLVIDFGFVFAVSGALYLLSRTRWFAQRMQLFTSIYMFLFAPAGVYAAALAPFELAWYAFPAAIIQVYTIHLLSRLSFLAASACSLAFSSFALAAAFHWLPFPVGEIPRMSFLLGLANLLGMFGSRALETYARRDFFRTRLLDRERARADRLLVNIMPESVANRLKQGERSPADRYDEVTILFADIVGFTALSADRPPERVVGMLNRLFSTLDRLAARHGVEKIKTIGDAYMVVAGLPTPRADHAAAIARLALEMQVVLATLAEDLGASVELRMGIHSGSVVAGVIGENKLAYDLWGDAVNVAARMEAHGLPGAIQVSAETHRRLGADFTFTPRGRIPIKGMGEMETFLLTGCTRDRETEAVPPIACGPGGKMLGSPRDGDPAR